MDGGTAPVVFANLVRGWLARSSEVISLLVLLFMFQYAGSKFFCYNACLLV